jgi:hypothetical protein
VENTALAAQGFKGIFANPFDWSDIPERKGKLLCSACGPSRYRDGKPTEFGNWHGEFERVFLPKGLFVTNQIGNLAHRETGDEDFMKYRILIGERL